jgi:hypothetical protein
MLASLLKVNLNAVPTSSIPPCGAASTPANRKEHCYVIALTSVLTLHNSITQSHTCALDKRSTANNNHYIVTVREFTADGNGKWY